MLQLANEDVKIDNIQFISNSNLRFRFDCEIVIDAEANKAATDPRSRPGSLRFYRCGLYKAQDGTYFAQLPTFARQMGSTATPAEGTTATPSTNSYTKSGTLPRAWVPIITAAAQSAAKALASSV